MNDLFDPPIDHECRRCGDPWVRHAKYESDTGCTLCSCPAYVSDEDES